MSDTDISKMSGTEIKGIVAHHVYEIADSVNWTHLTISQRKQYYEVWTVDPQIGGLLNSVMEPSRVRVYLKDTVMKSYSRDQRPTVQSLLSSMSIPYSRVSKKYVKPPALLCDYAKLYTLAPAKNWKIAIMSAFERGYEAPKLNENVVFITEHTTGRFVDREYRDLIEVAAKRLGITIHWVH